MHEKHQKKLFWAILVSETSHIFCCVLPTLFSLASVLAGLGVIATVPGWLGSFHDVMHGYEPAMIAASACVVALGWAVYFYSLKNDCHDVGDCHHAPCGPKKRRANKILIVATCLLVVNLGVYFGLHRTQDSAAVVGELHEDDHGHHDHHGHDH